MSIPGDLLEEIQRELAEASRALTLESDRLLQLAELNRLAVLVSLRLGRRITVVDLFEALKEDEGGLVSLLHALRGRGPR
jgi:hypothetical protein